MERKTGERSDKAIEQIRTKKHADKYLDRRGTDSPDRNGLWRESSKPAGYSGEKL